MRVITCPECGRLKPTPPEDAARGLFQRRQQGFAAYDMCCDYCGRELRQGDPAVALTCPADLMPGWEEGYLNQEARS